MPNDAIASEVRTTELTAPELIGAEAAAKFLGVQRATLYAYVSRGLLVSHRRPGVRGSWFDPRDLDRVRGDGRRGAARPDVLIESALTLITSAGHHYRGRPAIDLAMTSTFESTADLLWGVDTHEPDDWIVDDVTRVAVADAADRVYSVLPATASPLDAVRTILPVLAAGDRLRADLRDVTTVVTGRRLLHATGVALSYRARPREERTADDAAESRPVGSDSICRLVAETISTTGDPSDVEVDDVRMVMVMMADHELAASTSAVRLAASFGADPYAALIAGHAAFGGALHGAASTWVDRFLDELLDDGDVERVVGEWLSGGRRIPGLGQVLYPDGDPRGRALLDHAARRGSGEVLDIAAQMVELAHVAGMPAPNVDFALAVLAKVHGWRRGAGEILFGAARSAGWLAHAMEEYRERSSLRLRALYTGPRPDA